MATPTSSPKRAARIEPLSEARHKVQLTVSTEIREKLERATALLRHRNPSGDLAVVVERALDLLLADLEKEILGKTIRPQSKSGAATNADDGSVSRPARRSVFERDGEQCSFVDEDGNRCPATSFLEIDHVRPRACGGDGGIDNLRILCRAHNQWLAEEAFGREHIAQSIHLRRQQSSSRPPHRPAHNATSSGAPDDRQPVDGS